MKKIKEKRQWPRQEIPEPEPALVHTGTERVVAEKSLVELKPCFICVLNKSQSGMLIESSCDFATGSSLFFSVYDRSLSKWQDYLMQVAWTKATAGWKGYLAGLMEKTGERKPRKPLSLSEKQKSFLADVEFLLKTELFENIPPRAINYLLNCLTLKKLQAGKKLISQGEKGDALYIIRQGVCEVKSVKNGEAQIVNSIGKGGVVGEMAVLTGEKRSFDVFAGTDLVYWELPRQQYESVAGDYHELRIFLTELLTKRLETSHLVADRLIGKYQIKLKLGQGAWGIVYLGMHELLHMPVAVKMLKHQLALDDDFKKKFKNEAKIVARLKHPHIVDVYDIEDLYQTIFIVMEYLEGETLDARLQRVKSLPATLAVDYLVQICSGLAYAHKQGIVHQDIKPANIFLLADEQVKILDFGLACPLGYEGMNLLGTINYAAPEAINSKQVDVRSDIYSLGVTAYEMVTGNRPYPEEDLAALVDIRRQQEIPDPAGLVPGLPEALRAFIVKSCKREARDRYKTMDEALEALVPLHRQLVEKKDGPRAERQALANLNVFYREDQTRVVKSLLDDFSSRARDIGVLVKGAEFKDVF